MGPPSSWPPCRQPRRHAAYERSRRQTLSREACGAPPPIAAPRPAAWTCWGRAGRVSWHHYVRSYTRPAKAQMSHYTRRRRRRHRG
eukprot:scaffold9618_cov27-Tisochrysis_lutea.AAC.2